MTNIHCHFCRFEYIAHCTKHIACVENRIFVTNSKLYSCILDLNASYCFLLHLLRKKEKKETIYFTMFGRNVGVCVLFDRFVKGIRNNSKYSFSLLLPHLFDSPARFVAIVHLFFLQFCCCNLLFCFYSHRKYQAKIIHYFECLSADNSLTRSFVRWCDKNRMHSSIQPWTRLSDG